MEESILDRARVEDSVLMIRICLRNNSIDIPRVTSTDKIIDSSLRKFNSRFLIADMCNLPMDSGPCRGAFRKYYYEPGSRACREFVYGGCDGNANRFSTISECESICIHQEEPVPSGNDTSASNLCM
jgi:hypothetical protein